jgi:hypothetical protein
MEQEGMMKDITKTYHVKHDFGYTEIATPEEGYPIKLNINMTFQTFSFLLTLIFATGFTVINVIRMVSKITGG